MTFRKPSKRQLLDSCAEVRDDDGVDPKLFFRKPGAGRKLNRKTLQLCSQVADALNGLLVDCGDERLQALTVVSVEPAPDASRLLVTVGSTVPTANCDRQAVLDSLAKANGRLRAGVAEAITRKRAPQLVFHFAAPFSAGQAAEEGLQ
jgi:ribosome-binding factor A